MTEPNAIHQQMTEIEAEIAALQAKLHQLRQQANREESSIADDPHRLRAFALWT